MDDAVVVDEAVCEVVSSEQLECPICLDVCESVASLDACSHKFCYDCIIKWSEKKSLCPYCKTEFNVVVRVVGGVEEVTLVCSDTFEEPTIPWFRFDEPLDVFGFRGDPTPMRPVFHRDIYLDELHSEDGRRSRRGVRRNLYESGVFALL